MRRILTPLRKFVAVKTDQLAGAVVRFENIPRDFSISRLILEITATLTGTGNWTVANSLAPASYLKSIKFGRSGVDVISLDGEIMAALNYLYNGVWSPKAVPAVGSAAAGTYTWSLEIPHFLIRTLGDWGRKRMFFNAPGAAVNPYLELTLGTDADFGTIAADDAVITADGFTLSIEQQPGFTYTRQDARLLQLSDVLDMAVGASSSNFKVSLDVNRNIQALLIKTEEAGIPAAGILNAITSIKSGQAEWVTNYPALSLIADTQRRFQVSALPAGFYVVWFPGDSGDENAFLAAHDLNLNQLDLYLDVTAGAATTFSVYSIGYTGQ